MKEKYFWCSCGQFHTEMKQAEFVSNFSWEDGSYDICYRILSLAIKGSKGTRKIKLVE